MDIETIKEEKRILEKSIYKLLIDFNTKTKVLPTDINIITVSTVDKFYTQSLYNVSVVLKI